MHYFLTYTAVFYTTTDSLQVSMKRDTSGSGNEHFCLLVCDDMYSASNTTQKPAATIFRVEE